MPSLNGFYAEEYKEVSFDNSPLPQGAYAAVISHSENRQASTGGTYLSLTFLIIDGDYTNRKVWENLNLEHIKTQVVEIAKSKLASICRAVGVLKPKTTEELHDKPLIIHVSVQKRTDTQELTNRITRFESVKSMKKPSRNEESTSDNQIWHRK